MPAQSVVIYPMWDITSVILVMSSLSFFIVSLLQIVSFTDLLKESNACFTDFF